MRRILLLLSLFFSLSVYSQANKQYWDYIHKYADMAVDQMNKYHIPASITLSQGLLESASGKSRLAQKGNNHFGIKCGGSWSGRRVYHDDDAIGECFRRYRNVKESYEDHSLFLVRSSRYSNLFKLKITDYKGWARGLKRAGYATDPRYASRLINIIETYSLYRYDRLYKKRGKVRNSPWLLNPHNAKIVNGLLYVVVRSGDSMDMISKEFGVSKRKLRRYNELGKDYQLSVGDILYLKKKKTKASRGLKTHIVRPGESMYSISQRYGIQLKYLYKRNHRKADYIPSVGDELRLR